MQPAGDAMKGFSDSDWVGCMDTRQSMSGFVWIMGGGAICWKSKLQLIVALSSTEAEYVGATLAVQEVVWLRDLLCELGITNNSLSLLNMDNWGVISLTHGAGDSNWTKHIDIRYHFIQTHVECKCINIQYLLMDKMTVDILMKNLTCMKHTYFVSKLSLVSWSSGSHSIWNLVLLEWEC